MRRSGFARPRFRVPATVLAVLAVCVLGLSNIDAARAAASAAQLRAVLASVDGLLLSAGGTGALARYLASLPGGPSRGILLGQHTDYYTGLVATPFDDFSAGSSSPVNAQIAGYTPAILGLAIEGAYNGGQPTQATIGGTAGVVSLANGWMAAGGIVAMSLWPGNPASAAPYGASANSQQLSPNPCQVTAPNSAADILTPGTATYANWMSNLAQVAALLKQINGAVILRPFVELNGNWEWYGPENCTDGQFVAIWMQLWTYLHSAGVNNVLYNWNINDASASASARYPGSAYVDVVSYDYYGARPGTDALGDGTYGYLASLQKPILIAELGTPGNLANSANLASMLQDIKSRAPLVVAVIEWCQGSAIALQSSAAAVMADPAIINRPQLQAVH